MARRAAMLFLGVAVVTFLSRETPPSQLRANLCLGLAIMMAGLTAVGVFEFIRGAVGLGIWLAIVTEISFALAYFKLSKQE